MTDKLAGGLTNVKRAYLSNDFNGGIANGHGEGQQCSDQEDRVRSRDRDVIDPPRRVLLVVIGEVEHVQGLDDLEVATGPVGVEVDPQVLDGRGAGHGELVAGAEDPVDAPGRRGWGVCRAELGYV